MAQDDIPRTHGAFGYEGEGFMRTESAGPRAGAGHLSNNEKRSDDQIRDDIRERLLIDERVDASDIDVKVRDGVVILLGSVGDHMSKKRAADVADLVIGVRDVENQLRLRR